DLQGSVEYKQYRSSPTVMRLEFSGLRLPKELERALDVRDFGGPVALVSTFRETDGRVVVEVEHAEGTEGRVERKGDRGVWSFFSDKLPSTLSGVGRDGKPARKTHTITSPEPDAREAGPQLISATEVFEFSADQAAAFTPGVLGQAQGRYSGRRIDL